MLNKISKALSPEKKILKPPLNPVKSVLDREEATRKLLEAKAKKNVTFEKIAEEMELSEVYMASVILGQHLLNSDQAQKLLDILGLGADQELYFILQQVPYRGEHEMPPKDPTIYRLYELILVYGSTLKQLINEKFGDGIMSAIDNKVKIEKKESPEGPRILLTFDGKFLPYQQW